MCKISKPEMSREEELEYMEKTKNDDVVVDEDDMMHPSIRNECEVSMYWATTNRVCSLENFQAFYSKV